VAGLVAVSGRHPDAGIDEDRHGAGSGAFSELAGSEIGAGAMDVERVVAARGGTTDDRRESVSADFRRRPSPLAAFDGLDREFLDTDAAPRRVGFEPTGQAVRKHDGDTHRRQVYEPPAATRRRP
jgi:hypothetical protein